LETNSLFLNIGQEGRHVLLTDLHITLLIKVHEGLVEEAFDTFVCLLFGTSFLLLQVFYRKTHALSDVEHTRFFCLVAGD
jgi:hypothetical protein